jgi:UDP-glucose-4-epimerase GalE
VKVLATGGAGYVGSHVVRALRRAGHEVAILDSLARGHRAFIERLQVPLFEADLRDAPAVERAFAQGWDAVLHFAGLTLVSESMERPELYWDVNVRGGFVLLEAMRKARVSRLVVSSSAAVYGEPSVSPIPESAPKAPSNPYGQTKLAFEIALEREAHAFELRSLALRYFNAVGASDEGDLGEDHEPETHLLPNLLRAALRGETFQLYGRDLPTRDGTCLRDFVHVEDLARAHVVALEKLETISDRALNLGTGTGTTVLEAVRATERALGKTVMIADRPRRPGDPVSLVADPSRAAAVLGFRATRSLEDAIRSQARFREQWRR